jgi:hypothetical protein
MPVPPPAAPTKPGGQSGNATSRTKGKGGIPEPTPEEIELDKQRNRIKQSQNQMQKIQSKKKARSDSDTVHATILISGLICAFYGDESIDIENKYVPPITETLRLTNLILMPFQLFFCYMHYHYSLEIDKIQKKIYYKTTLIGSNLFRKFLIESVANIIHMPPIMNIFLTNEIRRESYIIPIDNYMSVVMMCRLYIVIRLFKNNSMWTNGRAERICYMNGFEPDGVFALKASLTEKALLWCVV